MNSPPAARGLGGRGQQRRVRTRDGVAAPGPPPLATDHPPQRHRVRVRRGVGQVPQPGAGRDSLEACIALLD
ncbi:hypothetical protein, partial [Nocardia farcinica]|uniref:hypothetical protein n=1 Tax=Nocardia farcinica TaxID=37329 RepID=UPI0024579565